MWWADVGSLFLIHLKGGHSGFATVPNFRPPSAPAPGVGSSHPPHGLPGPTGLLSPQQGLSAGFLIRCPLEFKST